MAERRNAAPGLIDGLTADLGGPRTTALLARLDAAVPWEELAKPVRRIYKPGKGPGRPPWSVVLMLKSLLLAKWFNLSDPQLEECLQDRLSFRRFVGLSLTDTTPDETTFVVFRRREAGVQDILFDRVLKHIERQGLLVRDGTLVDATIIEASRGQKRPDGTSTADEDASFTRKAGATRFGYKAHIAVDVSGIVTDYRLTTAKTHDIHCIDELTATERTAVYADSAYMSRERQHRYGERGVLYAAIFRRRRDQRELDAWQQRWNAHVAKLRARVEHPFAMLKQQCGYRRTRYRGRDRNSLDLCLALIACNIKRSLSLTPT